MSWPFGDGTVRPGDTFYDKISAVDYERCVLGPNGERGGTGEIYERVSHDRFNATWMGTGMTPDELDAAMDACEMIYDVEHGPFTMIRRKANV